MASDIIDHLTLESLRQIFQEAGYRVETQTDPVANIPYLRSATAGVAFDIRPGNPLAGDKKGFADIALIAVLQVVGEIDAKLPTDLANRWNTTRRFGRLQFSAPFLVFCLDVSVLNGVTPAYLRAQIELWDRLVQDLVPFLRTAFTEAAAPKDKSPAPATKDQSPAAAA
jgi:hypothetical protein